MLELTQEEVSSTISRASQIVEQKAAVSEDSPGGYDAYVSAAEEVGIPREAMLQALRERNLLPSGTVSVGDLVFALSADSASYPATVLRVVNEVSVEVKFLAGSQHTVSAIDVKPLSLVPGRVIQFQHEDMGEGIWYSGRLLEYDADKGIARVSCAATQFKVPITSIRVKAQKTQQVKVPATVRQLLYRTAIITGTTAGGIGFLLGYLLHGR